MITITQRLQSRKAISRFSGMKKSSFAAQALVKAFEEAFANYIGTDYSTAISTGIDALRISLLAHGLSGGDQVLTTPFTGEAAYRSISSIGVKAVFTDITEDTFNIDPEDIQEKINKNIKAIISAHQFGHPADMKAIGEIAQDHGIPVFEDCTQAQGATYYDKKVGSFGTGYFYFYYDRHMACGKGAMITTNDRTVNRRVRAIQSDAKYLQRFHETGIMMPAAGATIGLAKLKQLDYNNERRIEVSQVLNDKLGGMKGLITPKSKPGCTHVFRQYALRLTTDFGISRDEAVRKLRDAGIEATACQMMPIHIQPYYAGRDMNERHPVAEQIAKEILVLPISPSLSYEYIDFIVDTILRL